MPSSKHLVLYWAPAVAWMAAIFAVSSLQPATIENTSPLSVSSAVAHTVEYTVLSLLLSRLVLAGGRYSGISMWAIVLVSTIAYGLSDELHQAFVPGRVSSWVDVLYNSVGAVVGLTVAEVATRLLRTMGLNGLAAVVTGSPQPDRTKAPLRGTDVPVILRACEQIDSVRWRGGEVMEDNRGN